MDLMSIDIATSRPRLEAALGEQLQLGALAATEAFARARPADELGCLYYSTGSGQFVLPPGGDLAASGIAVHFGMPGGVLPRVAGQRIELV